MALGPTTVCVRKKSVYFCDGFVDFLVSLQPLAVVLPSCASLLSAHNSLRGGAVLVSLSTITSQRCAIINKRTHRSPSHLEPLAVGHQHCHG